MRNWSFFFVSLSLLAKLNLLGDAGCLRVITVIPPAKGVATFLVPAVWVVIMLVGQRPHIRLVFGSVEKVGNKPFCLLLQTKGFEEVCQRHGKRFKLSMNLILSLVNSKHRSFRGLIDDLLRAHVFAVQMVEDEVAVEAPKIVHEEDQFGFAFRLGVAQTDHPFQECLDSDDLEGTIVLIGFHGN